MIRTIAIAVICAAAFGLLRMPLEERILRQEFEAGLLPPALPAEATNALGQQLAFVSLGGLRSLVASALTVDAFGHFKASDWPRLEEQFRLIVTLAPHNPFYWEAGASHLAYDASSSMRDDTRLSAQERLLGFRNYVSKGQRFLEEGIASNPQSWRLYLQKGSLLSDVIRYRSPDFGAAAEAYQTAIDLGADERYRRWVFYCLARIPERAREAWKLGRELYQDEANRTPSLETTIFALENRLRIPQGERVPFDQLFHSKREAWWSLYWQLNNSLGYPTDGVAEELKKLPVPDDAPSP